MGKQECEECDRYDLRMIFPCQYVASCIEKILRHIINIGTHPTQYDADAGRELTLQDFISPPIWTVYFNLGHVHGARMKKLTRSDPDHGPRPSIWSNLQRARAPRILNIKYYN